MPVEPPQHRGLPCIQPGCANPILQPWSVFTQPQPKWVCARAVVIPFVWTVSNTSSMWHESPANRLFGCDKTPWPYHPSHPGRATIPSHKLLCYQRFRRRIWFYSLKFRLAKDAVATFLLPIGLSKTQHGAVGKNRGRCYRHFSALMERFNTWGSSSPSLVLDSGSWTTKVRLLPKIRGFSLPISSNVLW